MKKRILITAGPVYGKLDDNKIVSNRSRGIWAVEFAIHLQLAGHDVTLLVPDIMEKQFEERLGKLHNERGGITIRVQTGFANYSDICHALAPHMDAAIMAAAVVNWIPESPFPGKMPTDKKRIEIPFVLAPRVINEMKTLNPKLTLIGCKLLFSNDHDKLAEAAYHVVLAARCNAVVANDANLGLRNKHVFHQDRSITSFYNNFDGLYDHLEAIINDEHYRTESSFTNNVLVDLPSTELFDLLVKKYKSRWTQRVHGQDFVFGSLAVRNVKRGGYIVSPREKGASFSYEDAIIVQKVEDRIVHTFEGKATLNAPLLIRHLEKYPKAAAVVHFHSTNMDYANGRPDIARGLISAVDHAPPGTARDNERGIPGPHYFIKGHGWIIAVNENGDPIPNP